jgi:Ca-activated chloride channel homolog
VLSEVQLAFTGLSVSESYPRQVPDLFKGSQISILGRYSGEGRLFVNLEGQFQGRKRAFRHESSLAAKDFSEADFLPRLWASRKVGYLLDQIRLHGESLELKEEVIRLAKKYGFVTPYTSYLAAEDRDYGRREGRLVFPADRLSGNAGGGLAVGVSDRATRPAEARKEAALASSAITTQSGEAAVWASQALQGMKESEKISSNVRTKVVGEKTFFWKEEAWVDSEVEKATVPWVRLKFGSEEYFQILTTIPVLSRYFALGEKVTVVYSGKIYEVKNDQGERK